MSEILTDKRHFVIIEAAEVLVLRRLARQAIPMLKRSRDYGIEKRRMLAQTISIALDGMDADLEENE